MTMSYHEIQAEINRLESKRERQLRAYTQTEKLIASLKELQQQGEPKTKK